MKFYAKLLGLSPDFVKRQPTGSRIKILTLSQLLLIPVSIWFFSGFMIALNIMDSSWVIAVIVGVIASSLIYIVDRSFATSTGSKSNWLWGTVRLVFAIVSSIIGAVAIDTFLFEEDINSYQEKKSDIIFQKEKTNYLNNHLSKLTELEIERDSARAYFERRNVILDEEMNGEGSGIPGVGDVAKEKKAMASEAKITLDEKEKAVSEYRAKIESEAIEHAKKQSTISKNGIMTKIRDFHEFVLSDNLNKYAYLLFFSLMFLLETMLLLYKWLSAKSALEEAILREEEARRHHLLALKRQREKYNNAVAELGEYQVGEINKLSIKRA